MISLNKKRGGLLFDLIISFKYFLSIFSYASSKKGLLYKHSDSSKKSILFVMDGFVSSSPPIFLYIASMDIDSNPMLHLTPASLAVSRIISLISLSISADIFLL
jgi:hypothetical protein